VFERLADEDFAYLTTTGRKSGKPHRVEIWFALDAGRMFMLSGGGERADWLKNIRKDPNIRVQVGSRTTPARARVARGADDQRARELLDAKYMGWKRGKKLSSWARDSVPIVIEFRD